MIQKLTYNNWLGQRQVQFTYHSQTRRLLSSEVDTNLLFWSMKVIEFTGPKCLSYSWIISPERMSHCGKKECQSFNAWIFILQSNEKLSISNDWLAYLCGGLTGFIIDVCPSRVVKSSLFIQIVRLVYGCEDVYCSLIMAGEVQSVYPICQVSLWLWRWRVNLMFTHHEWRSPLCTSKLSGVVRQAIRSCTAASHMSGYISKNFNEVLGVFLKCFFWPSWTV